MTNKEKGAGGDAATSSISDKKKELEKKKRSRVKQLLCDVKKQVEFWFGDANLHKDRLLKKLISESESGYVDISVLTSFNRMKKLTTDTKLIARALKNSTVVEVNLEGTKLRRQQPLGEPPTNTDSCTVYVELLPKHVSHDWIEKVFSKCGNVVYVSIPRYRTTGDSKGFAFVEFENEEQAHKAIEMLNNPPEDAPRKAGIFPKTLNRKPIHLPEEEEEKKKRKKKKKKEGTTAKVPAGEVKVEMEVEASGRKRKHSTTKEASHREDKAQKVPSKQSEKKRRRSQITEEQEIEVPSKIRRTSHSERKKKKKDEKSKYSATEDETDKDVDEGNENTDDAVVKAKRKRKKKHKEKLKIGEEVIPLRVLSKKEWLQLKVEYLALQKSSMSSLKKCMSRVENKEPAKVAEEKMENEKGTNLGPQFVNGVIVKITDRKPLPARKIIKETLCRISPVAYVDILEGDSECHVRFDTPEGAKAVCAARSEVDREHNWKLEILAGDHEQRYWQKILVDRQVKLNRPREKKRGTEKLISKAEKIIIARAKEAYKHIRFDDD